MKKILFVILVSIIPTFASADVSVTLDVESPTGVIYNNTLTVTPCPVTDDAATTTVSAKCALEQAGTNPQWTNYGGDDWFLTAAGGASEDSANNLYWGWWSDFSYGQIALNKHELHDGEKLIVALGVMPLRIDTPTTITVDSTTTVTVEEFGFDAGFNGVWSPSSDANVNANGIALQTNAAGTVDIAATSTDPIVFTVSKTNFVPASAIFAPIATTTSTTSDAVVTDPPPMQQSSGGGGGGVSHSQLNVMNALAYLSAKQNSDGSYADSRLADWAAVAFAAADPGAAKTKLRSYLLSATPSMDGVRNYERHAMALEALGIDPCVGTPVNYVAPIVAALTPTQINASDVRDEIFALFPLLHAGYTANENIVQQATAYIVSKQEANGSWGDPDTTAAAIQSLSQVSSLPGVSAALGKAENYLHAQQQMNGGFSNSFTTSWTLQAISALNESTSAWAPSFFTPNDFLAALQQQDGGVEPTTTDANTRVWATEYAIPASLGKSWPTLLSSFPKPASVSGGGTGSSATGMNATSTATTTPVAATSTLVVATSTPETFATSTPLATVSASTTASTTTPHTQLAPKKHPAKKVTPVPVPQPVTLPSAPPQQAQTAAAGTAGDGFLTSVWHAVVSFFSHLL